MSLAAGADAAVSWTVPGLMQPGLMQPGLMQLICPCLAIPSQKMKPTLQTIRQHREPKTGLTD